MAEPRKPHRIRHAEIKAGVFLTFCLALFVAMLFVLGKFGRTWREKQIVNVAFTQANALRPDAPVHLNGMEVGRVKQIKILRVTPEILSKLPPLQKKDLNSLALNEAEREKLKEKTDAEIDTAARELLNDRCMVLLTLELLKEADTQRYRLDDDYRINGSVMGDSSVEINSGAGPAVPPNYDKYLLGTGGDMYTDLGKSIEQVKDILGSMAEMVGGDSNKKSIQEQLASFENFTGKMESASDSMLAKLPGMWDDVDKRFVSAGEMMADVEKKVDKLKPELLENLNSAEKSIAELKERTAASVTDVHKRISDYRKELNDGLAEWKKLAADYRETIPEQVHQAREWSDRFAPTVDKIDMFFTRADESLNKGSASTLSGLRDIGEKAGDIEEATYRLKRWPWAMGGSKDENIARAEQVEYQQDLGKRHYEELRAELERVRQNLAGVDSGDRARASRIEQLIRESDIFFEVSPRATTPASPAAPTPATPKKGRN
ncbi:MAG TPA: MlaD family protein [Planctomycetota bacterium]|nr:MlaD family protein [Planctomycetota bacterium]